MSDGASILLVEDDPIVADVTRRSLTRAGYRVQVAGNVAEALALFDPDLVDVVVTDLVMPGQSGLDLLRHVDSSGPAVPVIIVTGDPSVQAAAEAVRSDAFDFLTKPLARQELLDAVARAVQLRKDRRDAQAEARRREHEHRRLAARHERIASVLAVIYDRVPEGIVVIDRRGRIIDTSASFARLVGLPPVALFDRQVSTLFEPHPTAGDLQRLLVDLLASPSAEGWRGEIGIRTADLRIVPARASVSICETSDGRYLVALVSHDDEHEAQSEHLRRADRLASLSLFAGKLAHEIKNDVQALVESIGWLESPSGAPAPATVLPSMREGLRRVLEHVASIIEPLKPRVHVRGAVDVHDSVETVLALLRRAGRLRQIHVELVAEPDVIVLADKDEVHQIVHNLVSNAIDALGDGGGELRGSIAITLRCEGAYGVIAIRDDGSGIAEATRARVFEPFFTTKGPAGTGLGLAVVGDIVRSLRGRVSLDCPPEGGTVVTVVLPRYRA